MKIDFEVEYLEEAIDFLKMLDPQVRKKIALNIEKARLGIDDELLKKLTGPIWEFRTFYAKKKYRLLCFWDTRERTLIIATNGFVKKTQKTHAREIERAEALRKKYMNEKYGEK